MHKHYYNSESNHNESSSQQGPGESATSSANSTSSSSEEKHYNELEGWLSKLTVGTPLAESEVKNLCENGRLIVGRFRIRNEISDHFS